MTDPSRAKGQVSELYNRVAATYGQVGPRIFERFGRRLVKLMSMDHDAAILDIATGRGASLFPVARSVSPQGFLIGVDLAAAMLAESRSEARRLGLANIHLVQMEGEHLAFPSNSFQVILCGFAIFLFPDPQGALKEWYRVLSPSAKIGICLAGQGDERWHWYEELLFGYYQRYRFSLSPTDSDVRKAETIVTLLTHVGFKEIEVVKEEYEFVYGNKEEWWEAKWTHGARFPLEQWAPDVLHSFKTEVFKHLPPLRHLDGFHEKWRAVFILGKK